MNSQIHFLNEAKRLAPRRRRHKNKHLLLSGKGNIFWKEKIKKKIARNLYYKIGYTISD